jgi:hypothetical protein
VTSAPSRSVSRKVPDKTEKVERQAFDANSKGFARLNHNEQPKAQQVTLKTNLTTINAAMPHRMSWMDIRDNTTKFHDGTEKAEDFKRWTDRFIDAGQEKLGKLKDGSQLHKRATKSHTKFIKARDDYLATKDDKTRKVFDKQANQYFANVPDLGPHDGVNNPVRESSHLHFEEVPRGRSKEREPAKRQLSPMSRRVADMSPGRLSGIAVDKKGDIIDTRGKTHTFDSIDDKDKRRIQKHKTKVISSFNPSARGPFDK